MLERAPVCADELAMADDAFALSPISARAAQPSEADYDAIQQAFMETSRGRWFLGEYAKRNRNADTRMVLDAVARIEDTLAASRKPERDPLLDEALGALRAALTQAREAAQAAVSDLALDQNLAPVRKGARVIREIAWRLREIGADSRICDLIDSQVGAIEAAAAKMAPADLAHALSGAFDGIEEKIAAFDASEAATSPPPQAVHAAETGQAVAPSEPHDVFDANDEALLDMIAMEMAAPDSDAAYEPKLEDAQIYEDQVHENQVRESHASESETTEPDADESPTSAASYEIDVTFPEDSGNAHREAAMAATPLPEVTPLQSSLQSPLQSLPAPEPEPISIPPSAPELSLGSSLIANGIVQRPRASRPDPLAPIRRMSQTEKIAFFS
jgi:hypothetical protein